MECPNESQVAAVADGAMVARSLLLDHVDDCAACRTLLATLVRETEASPHAWRAGLRLGRYVIGEPIGRGGMGSVWRAEDTELGRAVALKRLHAGRGIFREARTAAQLQHPNVVAVYEVVDDPHAPFLAMELVDGVTLTAWLKQPRSWREVVAIVAQAGRGLAAAHARGLVHRDFKPDNVLVDHEGRARVADFGLASTDVTLGDASDASCKLARVTASAAGTPAYMAPELVDGAVPDVRSDVYAYAVTLFEALHGQHPFAGTTVETIWIEMAAGRIRDGKARVPAWLERCVRRGLAVEPRDRWPDVASFVAAIDRHAKVARRYVAGAAFAGFAVAAGAAWLIAPASQGDDCAAGADRIGGLWNPSARTGLTAELVRAAPDGAVAQSTARIVDHWATAWQVGRRAACSAGEHRVARIACLDHQLDELGGLLTAWSSASGIDRAVSAAAGLPATTACDTAADAPFRVQPVVMRIDELKTLWRSGRSADALPKLPALLRDAEALGHHDTLATALLVASIVEAETRSGAESGIHANRAATEAAKAGDDAVLYAAMIQQAYARIDAGQPGDALGICDAAEALSARGVPSPEKALIARGGALMRLGRTPEAIVQYQKAIAMIEPAANRDPVAHIALGIATGGLGNAYLESRDPERAVVEHRRALAIQEADYGPSHPEIARTLHDLAQAETTMRDFAPAIVHLRRARAILVAAYGAKHPEVGEADVALANITIRQGRIDEARALFEQARAELSATLPPNHQIFSVIEAQLGSLEQNADHADKAIPHYEKAFAILVANHVGGDDLARVEVDLAACLLDQGRLLDAKVRAEDTIEQLTRAGAPEAERAMPLTILALTADARGDRAQAITLARQVLALTTDDDSGQRSQARVIVQDKLRAWTRS